MPLATDVVVREWIRFVRSAAERLPEAPVLRTASREACALWSLVARRVALGRLNNAAEHGFTSWHAAGDDADVELDHGPDGEVTGVPKPVGANAVFREVG